MRADIWKGCVPLNGTKRDFVLLIPPAFVFSCMSPWRHETASRLALAFSCQVGGMLWTTWTGMLTAPLVKYGFTSQRWGLFVNSSTPPSWVCISCFCCCCCPWLRWSHVWCALDKLGGVSTPLQTWRVLDCENAEIFSTTTRPWLKRANTFQQQT